MSLKEEIAEKRKEMIINATRRGTRALDRMIQLIKFSRVWFAHED